MPELPEVETVCRSLAPRLAGRHVRRLLIRNAALRWPIDPELPGRLAGAKIGTLNRRAKYILIDSDAGRLLIHLGMSGSLRVLRAPEPPGKHDHYDLVLDDGNVVRFNDPRRFGSITWIPPGLASHPLLDGLGIEPLSDEFDGPWLYHATRGRRVAIKLFLMDSRRIAGIGNIYANEALYYAGIHPATRAERVGPKRCERLAGAVRSVLTRAVEAGGSSLRDFVDTTGACGHFQLEYRVYGRDDEPCTTCGRTVRVLRQGQRSTFYCPGCQR
jgi:formamidopyrimidine-DNA glycosylase